MIVFLIIYQYYIDNDKLITIYITYISNTDNITNLEKYVLTKPHIMLVSFNHTNWNLSVLTIFYLPKTIRFPKT